MVYVVKKLFKISFLLFFILLTGCDKLGTEIPTNKSSRKINKTWKIEKLFLNDTQISLNTDQLKYCKTYISDSFYYDTDGIEGTFEYDSSASSLIEKVTLGGSEKLSYKVISLSDSILVMRLIDDGKINPNTKFHYRAK